MEIVIDSFATSMASNETMSGKDSVKYIAELLERIEQADRFRPINRIRKEGVWVTCEQRLIQCANCTTCNIFY